MRRTVQRRAAQALVALVVTALTLLGSTSQAAAIRSGFDTFSLPANDDNFSSFINLPFNLNFFGTTFNGLYVNNNGNVTFDAPLSAYTPFDLTSTGRQIIAPFFADVDTRFHGNAVTWGTGTADGFPAFGVNWIDVDYFFSDPAHGNQLNSFQLILIDRTDTGPNNFDIEFNFDRIVWETGDADGGFLGLGGNSARVGLSNGTGLPDTFYEFPGSAVPGSLLDDNTNTGLIHNRLNSNIDGRYVFLSRQGEIEFPVLNPLLETVPPDGNALDFGSTLVGSTANATLFAGNIGDPGSELNGTFPAASSPFGPGTTQDFGPVAEGDSVGRNYTFSPTARGAASQNVTVTSDGGESTVTLTGQGVAPVQSIDSSDAGLTRIGTTSTLPAEFTITNIGDGNLSGAGGVSNLNGSVDGGNDPRFVGGNDSFSLPDGASQTYQFAYTPTTHTVDSTTVIADFDNGSADGTNSPQQVPVTLSGQGVGPIYDSTPAPGSTIDFGEVPIGLSASQSLDIFNISTDPNGGDTTLTDLTLLSAVISGADADAFSLFNFTAGMVLGQGDSESLMLAFDSAFPAGARSATLTILTDQNAPFGEPGLAFVYRLQGVATPEPASAAVFGLAVLGGLATYRARRRNRAAGMA